MDADTPDLISEEQLTRILERIEAVRTRQLVARTSDPEADPAALDAEFGYRLVSALLARGDRPKEELERSVALVRRTAKTLVISLGDGERTRPPEAGSTIDLYVATEAPAGGVTVLRDLRVDAKGTVTLAEEYQQRVLTGLVLRDPSRAVQAVAGRVPDPPSYPSPDAGSEPAIPTKGR